MSRPQTPPRHTPSAVNRGRSRLVIAGRLRPIQACTVTLSPMAGLLVTGWRLTPPALPLGKLERNLLGVVLKGDVVKCPSPCSCFLADLPCPNSPDDVRSEYPYLEKTTESQLASVAFLQACLGLPDDVEHAAEDIKGVLGHFGVTLAHP